MRATIAVLVVLLGPLASGEPVTLSDRTVVHTTFDAGCAAAWRISVSGSLLWYFTLKSPQALTVSEREGAVILANANVVARDDLTMPRPANKSIGGRPSMLRVHRSAGSCVSKDPKWIALLAELQAQPDSDAVLQKGEWIYIIAGPRDAPRLVVRMAHVHAMGDIKPKILRNGDVLFANATGDLFDDGTFASAEINPEWLFEEVSARTRFRRATGMIAPELSITRWLQTESPLPLAQLKDKVVLLDFWGVWCQPCVASLPALAELRKAIPSDRFVILGIHSATGAENLDAFLKKQAYPGPIGVDGGEKTAKSYQVTSWPTYVLIDRQGRVRSYGGDLPAAATIEELLK